MTIDVIKLYQIEFTL